MMMIIMIEEKKETEEAEEAGWPGQPAPGPASCWDAEGCCNFCKCLQTILQGS